MIDSLSILLPDCMAHLAFPYEICVEFLCCFVQFSCKPSVDPPHNSVYKVPETTLQYTALVNARDQCTSLP